MINTEEENNNGTKYCDELNGAKQEEEEEEEVEEVEEPFFVTMMKMKIWKIKTIETKTIIPLKAGLKMWVHFFLVMLICAIHESPAFLHPISFFFCISWTRKDLHNGWRE